MLAIIYHWENTKLLSLQPFFLKEQVIFKSRENMLITIEVPFIDELSGLFTVKY